MECPNCGAPTDGPTCAACDAPPKWWRLRRSLEEQTLASVEQRVRATVIDIALIAVVRLALWPLTAVRGAALVTIVAGVYFVVAVAIPTGQTLGQRITGIRVRDAVTANRAVLRQAIVRWVAGQLPLTILLFPGNPIGLDAVLGAYAVLDGLFAVWDRRSETLHDKFAGTVVAVVERA